ncbi:MAG: serine/threonine protein kinase [Candidatus Melainabacteria bacterium]|nr:serine/threonine protein kinase [Candidatus Melainabacteria bacterium]
MAEMIDSTLLDRYRLGARVVALIVMVLAIPILWGWGTGNYSLTRLVPDFGGSLPFAGQVHSADAICLMACSVGLLLVLTGNTLARRAGYGLSACVGLIAALVLVSTITGNDLESIRLFAPEPSAPGIEFPTPMIPEVAFTIMLISFALATFNLPGRGKLYPVQVLAIPSMVVPLLILFGSGTGALHLCGLGGCFEMSLVFALMALSLSIAILLARSDLGYAELFTSRSLGGRMIRRATLLILAIPILLTVRIALVNTYIGKYPVLEEPMSWCVFGLTLFIMGVAVIVSGAKNLDQVEYERREIAEKLEETEQELSRSRTDNQAGTSMGLTASRFKRVCLNCTREYDDATHLCPVDGTELSRIVDESLTGTIFADKYEVTTLLGKGGMSIVYKARHRYLDKDFAIKVLKSTGGVTGDMLQRFRREAKATSALSHAGIVGVHDFGLAPDGRAYIVMDYVEGESLADFLKRQKRLDLIGVAGLADSVCSALAYSHARGIVHRDLKPANIMLVREIDGRMVPKIVDFGLAKIISEDGEQSMKLTQTGECFGSPLYMSPEQCMGNPMDHRTDIYALGCIVYECLSGRPPFIGKNVLDTFRLHVNEPPPELPASLAVPEPVKVAIFRSLSKMAADRPESALEIRNALLQSVRS